MNIDKLSNDLAEWHPRWKRIRDVMKGEYAVKAAGEAYLPLVRTGQPQDEYARFLKGTPFFPATKRTAQGWRGLMFARNVVFNAPILEPIKNVLTVDGMGFRDFAEDVVWEAFQTNYHGLLVDFRSASGDLNLANALANGHRPFIFPFPGENILDVAYGDVRGQSLPIRVVLKESDFRILELFLKDGVYHQTVWTNESGKWSSGDTRIPLRDSKPLDEIPFVIVSDNTKKKPQEPVLEDVTCLNLNHFIAQGRISSLEIYGAAPVPVITGVIHADNKDTGEKDVPALFMGPGGIIYLPNPDSKAFFLEAQGHMAEALNRSKRDIEEQMAKTGARMLAPERVAPEAEATVRMRSAAENSTNASLAMTYAERISQALGWCAWWMGGERTDAVCTLNTDYENRVLTAQDRQVAMAELQGGLRSWEDWFYERRDAGLVNASLTPEAERARIEQDNIDRPTAEI